jgi:hypothetical protein
MKRHLFAIAVLLALALAAPAQLPEAKNVYVMPMSGGLDQHLALRLTEERVLQVVTDPTKADVLFTDRIGAGFDKAVEELYAHPAETKGTDSSGVVSFNPPAMRPMSRSRGAVFLVERSTRNVVWSTFEEPRSTDPKDLYKTAQRIVSRLAKAMRAD